MEWKPRAKVSKETGPMLNDDGQDTDWSSLIDESGFQSQGTSSSDSLSSISSSDDSSSDSSSDTDSSDNSA